MDDQPPQPLVAPPDEREPAVRPPPRAPHRPSGYPESPPRARLGRALSLLLVLLIVGGGVAWVVYRGSHPPAPTGRFQTTGPVPVGTAKVEKGDMPIVLTALGTVTPLAMVTVKTQIAGQLVEVAFEEGQVVKKGDFLAQIDPRPYQVALAQAEGQLAKDQAILKNSEVDLARYRTLAAQNSIARQTLDTQTALVQQNRGTVQADQALVDTQKLNLSYCRIVAPVGGRVGLRQVDPGNYVQTSDPSGIVVITQIQPISVIFTLPEDQVPEVMRRLQAGARLPVTAFNRTGKTRLDAGVLQTVDNQVDTSTGTVKLRAVFDNPEQALFPNQFVNVQLLVDTLRGVAVVPTAAIQRGAPGTFAYVVMPDETAVARPVTLGPNDDQRVAVTRGLEPGDVVVTDGADRLKDGAKVRLAPPGRTGGASGLPAAGPAPAAARAAVLPPSAESAGPPQERPRGQGQGRRRGGE
jgi:multidrug efflux system membrane fusion protein